MNQKDALKIMKAGSNVFLTGAAGSGKTYVLNQFIEHCRNNSIKVAKTASTGIAATHINGQTIHAWSGIGIKDSIKKLDINNIIGKRQIVSNYKMTQILIIDEISMLGAVQFEMIDFIARKILNSDKPFGGLQVIVCGDFFQLPPVSKNKKAEFAYQSKVWEDTKFSVCYLHEQHRQSNDDLTKVLNAVRKNKTDKTIRDILNTKKDSDVQEATKLYCKNIDVDRINNKELEKLTGETKTFDMKSWGNPYVVEALKKSCLAYETLNLKVNAKVIFIRNHRDGYYVNGTQGTVIKFLKCGYPVIQTKDREITVVEDEWIIEDSDGRPKAGISQLPLRLAWALTVHKSQGMTLDSAEIDLSDAFEPGMGYVALSRLRNLEGLHLKAFNTTALEINKQVLDQDKIFKKLSEGAEMATELTQDNVTALAQKIKPALLDLFLSHKDLKVLCDELIAKTIDTSIDYTNLDITDENNRKLINKTCRSLGGVSTKLDNIGKEEVAKLKELPKKIDEGRRVCRTIFDELKETIRKPLDAWELEQQFLEDWDQALKDNELFDLRKLKEEKEKQEREEALRKEGEERAKKEALIKQQADTSITLNKECTPISQNEHSKVSIPENREMPISAINSEDKKEVHKQIARELIDKLEMSKPEAINFVNTLVRFSKVSALVSINYFEEIDI